MSFYTRFGATLLAFEAISTMWNLVYGNTGWVLFGVVLIAATVVQLLRSA